MLAEIKLGELILSYCSVLFKAQYIVHYFVQHKSLSQETFVTCLQFLNNPIMFICISCITQCTKLYYRIIYLLIDKRKYGL